MNILFLLLFLLSSAALALREPAAFLPALMDGAERALRLSASLCAVYAVWLGVLQVAKDARLTDGLARLLRPLTSRLLGVKDEEALRHAAVNFSANLLGAGGAATPAGVAAMRRLDALAGGRRAQAVLFAVNCAGLQLIPVTAVALRERLGAAAPYDVILPVFLASAAALAFSLVLLRLLPFGRRKD